VAIAIGLLKMLLQLQESRRTGALDVVGPAARVRFFVDEGLIVHADEGTVGETLGRILVRERVVDQEQYSAAIEWMTELRASGKKAMLGEVFVDLGLLSTEQVRAALAAQVQSKALRALAWPQARFRFMESFGPLVLKDRFVTSRWSSPRCASPSARTSTRCSGRRWLGTPSCAATRPVSRHASTRSASRPPRPRSSPRSTARSP